MKGLHSTFLIVTLVQVMCFTIVSHKPKKEIINLVIYCPINRENIEPHNLEVPGSSPGWSTLEIKHLQRFCKCFFYVLAQTNALSRLLFAHRNSSFYIIQTSTFEA